MNRKLAKIYALVIVVMLFTSSLTGCGQKVEKGNTATAKGSTNVEQSDQSTGQETEEPSIDTTKEVELISYMIGEAPAGFDTIMGEVNKKLKEKINATLKINLMSWGDYGTKYPLILSSGEPCDIIFTASWCFFTDQALKGGFMALDELLPKYAPNIMSVLPKEALEQAKINGKVYMIPSAVAEPIQFGYCVRGDLRKKYGLPEIKNLDDFGNFLGAAAQNEKGMIPYDGGINDTGLLNAVLVMENQWSWGPFEGTSVFTKYTDPKSIFYWYLTPEFEQFAKKTKSWADKGYWSKNVLSNKGTAKDSMINGKCAGMVSNLSSSSSVYNAVKKDHPDWEIEWFEPRPDLQRERSPYTSNGDSIPASSQNPERALMAIDLLTMDQELNTMINYGIKGKNYTVTADGLLDIPADMQAYSGGDISVWGFGNPKFIVYPVSIMPGYTDKMSDMDKRAISNPYGNFVLNRDNINSEVSACGDVTNQYGQALTWGLVPDVDAALATLKEKLEQAGVNKVVDECKKQAEAYFANQGK